MKPFAFNPKPLCIPPLDPDFQPISLGNRAFRKAVTANSDSVEIVIALERERGFRSVHRARVFGPSAGMDKQNCIYVDRLVKSLLWVRGGWLIQFGGPSYIGEYLRAAYADGGSREFERGSWRAYMRAIHGGNHGAADVPPARESPQPRAATSTARIGFDAGGSDRKVSASLTERRSTAGSGLDRSS